MTFLVCITNQAGKYNRHFINMDGERSIIFWLNFIPGPVCCYRLAESHYYKLILWIFFSERNIFGTG